jgi:uncharacterized membrane protein
LVVDVFHLHYRCGNGWALVVGLSGLRWLSSILGLVLLIVFVKALKTLNERLLLGNEDIAASKALRRFG